MADRTDGDDGGPSHDAFEVLADETRLGILRTLADHRRDHPEEPGLGFSDLRRAVGVRDSGNFNYHLQQLLGRFVTETDGNYRLAAAGFEVVGAALAGVYDDREDRDPVELADPCPICGGTLTASYEDGLLSVTCPDEHVFQNSLPPGAIEGRNLDGVVDLLTIRTQQSLELALQGVCPNCYARLGWSIDPDAAGDPPEFRTRCDRCGVFAEVPAGTVNLRHPVVVSFFHDHGIDVRERPYWSPVFWDGVSVSTPQRDPLRVLIEIDLDDERLCQTVDRTLDPVAVDREPIE